MLIEYTCLIVVSLLVGISIHYLSHRIAWGLEREWLDEALDFLDLDEQQSQYSEKLAYPNKLPSLFNLWPWVDKNKVLDGPYTPWWLSCLFLFLFSVFHSQFDISIAFGCSVVFIVITVLASRIDFCHQVLPDKLNYLLLWCGLAINTTAVFTPLTNAVWAVILGYCLIGGMSFLMAKLFKRTMLGGGDVKFIAGIGAWVGIKGLLPVILIGSIVFVLIMVLGGWLNNQWDRMSAFGPYLTLGGLVTLWFGPGEVFTSLQSWMSV